MGRHADREPLPLCVALSVTLSTLTLPSEHHPIMAALTLDLSPGPSSADCCATEMDPIQPSNVFKWGDESQGHDLTPQDVAAQATSWLVGLWKRGAASLCLPSPPGPRRVACVLSGWKLLESQTASLLSAPMVLFISFLRRSVLLHA